MITEYFEGLRSGKDKKEAIMYMATKCALPITLTTATTVFGFSSLAFNKITILKQFGIVTTFGLSINFLITIIVIPSFLQFMNVPGIFQKKKRNPLKRHIDSFIDWFIKLPTQHKTLITVGTLFCIGLALAGCFRLKVNTDFISYFKEGSYIRQRVNNGVGWFCCPPDFKSVIVKLFFKGFKGCDNLRSITPVTSKVIKRPINIAALCFLFFSVSR